MVSTKEKIEKYALQEFLEYGFNGASLRRIVKDAGVTTGAFYKYYASKEALFAGLVQECVDDIYAMYDDNYERFITKSLAEQTQEMLTNANDLTHQMVDYIYAHFDRMKLVLTASEGTPFDDFVHQLALREERSTFAFAQLLRENGCHVPELDKYFVHMVAHGLFSSVFEIVLHHVEKEKAYEYISQIKTFYSAGWERIFNIRFS